jgi:putative restriction endonuclease
MTVSLVVAVTDGDWFEMLRRQPDLAEVNFWAPSASSFRALTPGELFLFKLHAPRNVVVGGGVFAYANALPFSLAWAAFGVSNGARSMQEMRARIVRYRRTVPDNRSDFTIGCRILTQPFFFDDSEWIAVPSSWSKNIVTFKTYSTAEADGVALWEAVQDRLSRSADRTAAAARFGKPTLILPRLGQGAFRVVVTDAYHRRCAITRERTLPALEAAHIRPYAEGGDHEPRNGLLLRRDIHSLFDAGYVTVTPSRHFEVSRRIKEEFDNGRHYYDLHGRPVEPPDRPQHAPDPAALAWHNEHRFMG